MTIEVAVTPGNPSVGAEPSPSVQYHLAELAIVLATDSPHRLVPCSLPNERSVLDIGCGVGQTLLSPELCTLQRRCGVDIDQDAVDYGARVFPELELQRSGAEQLPFGASEFDLVISRVALPYTNIPVVLREIRRVLRPGGRFWATLHPPALEFQRFRRAVRAGNLKTLFDSAYVWLNTLAFHSFGVTFPRPWSGLRECVQTVAGTRRSLARAGFKDVVIDRRGGFLMVEARTP